MSALQPLMKSSSDEALLLERVAVSGTLHGTIARITMRQEYRNESDRNVEAIYTFPLPPAAVLLRTIVELGGKRYGGVVMAKARAEAGYEEAIAEGNTAIMVERPEVGLYTMNLGNLMAGETACIEIEFSQLLDWHHGKLRLALPMTIAPRYGEDRSALQPQQRPHISMLVERPFSLELRVGSVAGGFRVSSPSHNVSMGPDGSDMVVSLLQGSAWMDRDFILAVESTKAPEPCAVAVPDAETFVGYASFQVPDFQVDAAGRDVRIVLDCSGSMAGDSIALAKRGVFDLLKRLRPVDRLGIVAFGSTTLPFRSTLVEATGKRIEEAIAWVAERGADLGGTEMAAALEATMKLGGGKGPATIFLVTDGQVGESNATVQQARRLKHRVFVVGIGVSASRGLLEQIAETTGGAIDYIGPQDDVAETMRRQFARVTQVPVTQLGVEWDVAGQWKAGVGSRGIFSGDTIHAFAGLPDKPRSARITYQVGDSEVVVRSVACAALPEKLSDGVLPRIASERRILEGLANGSMETGFAEGLAVRHQLVTEFTNYLLVVDRGEDNAQGSPITTPVKTMLAAGWGGTGREFIAENCLADFAVRSMSVLSIQSEVVLPEALEFEANQADWPGRFLARANAQFGSVLSMHSLPMARAALHSLGLTPDVENLLEKLIAEGHEESQVVQAFWAALLEVLEPASLKRGLQRKLRAMGKAADRALVDRILAELRAVEAVQ